MKYIVTDKPEYIMSIMTSEKLKQLVPKTPEESFPFPNELVFCYKRGSLLQCQEFLNTQHDK